MRGCSCHRRTVRPGYHDGELEEGHEGSWLTDFYDVGLGGDMTAAYEVEDGRKPRRREEKVTSCCPAFVNMVRFHYPQLADCVSTTVSPMRGLPA